ncbi:hypothetical protein FXW78_11880 [Rhodococcus opacus]|nr:hypothetical protein [Rhodococcus opacus]RZL84089.1 MAG: hypothetical protein EOP32_04975 [Rhodococcus sp. (in: high G+C Gram-positive bacteria)]
MKSAVLADSVIEFFSPGHLATVTVSGALTVLDRNRQDIRTWPAGYWIILPGRGADELEGGGPAHLFAQR